LEWLGGVAIPVLLALGAGMAWLVRNEIEERRAAEERLSADRREVYRRLLVPYVRLFGRPGEEGAAKAVEEILSFDYRAVAFDFMLVASDEAAQAYNALMQYTFKEGDKTSERPWEMMLLWGRLLLEIRRSLGNKGSKLTNVDMLRFFIKDIETLEEAAAAAAAAQQK